MQENWSSFASRYDCLYLLLLSYLICSDPHPPNLGLEGDEGGDRNCQNRGKDK